MDFFESNEAESFARTMKDEGHICALPIEARRSMPQYGLLRVCAVDFAAGQLPRADKLWHTSHCALTQSETPAKTR